LNAFKILISLACLPILAGYYYSYNQSLFSLFSSILFIVLFSSATLITTTRLNQWLAFILNLLVFLSILVFEIMLSVSYYLQGEGFNERFFFHFTWGTIQSTWSNYPALFWLVILLLCGFSVLIYQVSQKNLFKSYSLKTAIILFLIALIPHSAVKEYTQYQLNQTSGSQSDWSIERLESLGLNMASATPGHKTSAEPGKNLVLIYMESLESIYTNEDNFKTLTPNLNQYKKNGVWFSNLYQTPGTSWTIAGVSSSLCGTPLLSDNATHGNDIMLQGFLNNATCLSDTLHNAGYEQHYLGGATLEFAGKGAFLRHHAYDKVTGLDELLPDYNNKDYLTSWGFYDDTLFDMAVDKFQTLADEGSPFNLTLLTLDTHHPKGHPSASCTPYAAIDNSILHAVHCTDQLVDRFIQRISKHPAWADTIVVLFSDHLSMRNDAEPYYPRGKERKLSFIVLNSALSGQIETPGTHMDVAPTILDLLNVTHNNQFLAGQSLLKERNPALLKADKQTVLTAIRHVNSHFLTRKGSQLCPDQTFELSAQSKKQLMIGNYNLSLSYQGHTISNSIFRSNLAQITFFNKERQIKQAFIVSKKDVPDLVKKNAALDFLLLHAEQEELKLYFGDNNGLVNIPLTMGKKIKKLDVSLNHCFEPSALSSAGLSQKRILLTDLAAYKKQCKTTPEQFQAFYHKDQQQIIVPIVLVNDTAYSATFQKQDQQSLFTMTDHEQISVSQNQKELHKTLCLPELSTINLYLPQLNINDKAHDITLPIKTETGQLIIPETLQSLF